MFKPKAKLLGSSRELGNGEIARSNKKIARVMRTYTPKPKSEKARTKLDSLFNINIEK